MLKWQENFLAGESVKDPEKIKKETEQRKTGSGHLSPYSVRESCESDGYYSCSNADTEEFFMESVRRS